MIASMPLRIVLGLAGLALIILGTNVGLGGIATLGLQVDPGFVAAVDQPVYQIQDSHVRFNGGILAAIGAFFVAGGISIARVRTTLIHLSIIIAIAGLFRLSQPDNALFGAPDLIRSFLFELFFFPALAFWIHRTVKPK